MLYKSLKLEKKMREIKFLFTLVWWQRMETDPDPHWGKLLYLGPYWTINICWWEETDSATLCWYTRRPSWINLYGIVPEHYLVVNSNENTTGRKASNTILQILPSNSMLDTSEASVRRGYLASTLWRNWGWLLDLFLVVNAASFSENDLLFLLNVTFRIVGIFFLEGY
jgi:hypothetical protein